MRVGIEKMNLYASRFSLDLAELAQARGRDPHEITGRLMCESRSVIPVYEDAVTLAVNVTRRLLSPTDLADIELLVVVTESAVDFGKPISTWVHRLCHLPANCRNFEVKHACYSGTGALQMAAAWIALGLRPGKKALVINTDFSRTHLGANYEYVLGGGAIAMLISANPQILELELHKTGYWTHEVSDSFRPTSSAEMINSQLSLYSYLDALEGAYTHYEQSVGQTDYEGDFKKHIYHAPFPGMTLQAHRTMLNRFQVVQKAAILSSFHAKVSESLHFIKRIGSVYGGSTFVCLLGLLHAAQNLNAGDRISLFAYGSGCQGEFYSGVIGPAACDAVRSLGIDQHLDERLRLSVEQYEAIERTRECYREHRDYEPRDSDPTEAYDEYYKGEGLLVLKHVKNYHREYEWS